jgi:hypothetical protein
MATLLLLSWFVPPGCSPEAPSEGADPSDESALSADSKADVPTNSAYYALRRDERRCRSPLCGGWFVHRINRVSTACADGVTRAECYVAAVDWSQAGAEADAAATLEAAAGEERLITRGLLHVAADPALEHLGVLAAKEAWQLAVGVPAPEPIYFVRDAGVRCFTFPCFSITERLLNASKPRTISDVDLATSGADAETLAAAEEALTAGPGLVVGGASEVVPQVGPAGNGVTLRAESVYLEVAPTHPIP